MHGEQQQPPLSSGAPSWVWPLVAGAVALVAGFCLGWIGNRAYLAHQLEAAFSDMAEDGAAADEIPGEGPETEEAASASEEVPEEEKTPSDGLFTYTVTEAEEASSYTDEFDFDYHANESFVIVTVEAENTGDMPAMPADPYMLDSVTALDSEGAVHQADDGVSSGASDVNPGSTATYDIVFDVVEGTELVELELAASAAPEAAFVGLP